VDPKEHVLALADPKMLAAPFCYLAGHKLVEFSPAERRNFEHYVRNGGFVFVDDCNHDIDGLFAKSFEAQMASIFGPKALRKLPNSHPLYRSNKDYGCEWDYDWRNKRFLAEDNTKFAVNIVMYALNS
jgi:hypothetical protein